MDIRFFPLLRPQAGCVVEMTAGRLILSACSRLFRLHTGNHLFLSTLPATQPGEMHWAKNVTPGTGTEDNSDGFVGLHDDQFWKDALGNGSTINVSSNNPVSEPTTVLLVLMIVLGAP
jgi:hypothetical protein